MAGEYKSRAGDGNDELKAAPCGKAGAPRGSNVYTFEPGQTITIKLKEYVPHPGYFRIAFDNDGDDGFMEPQSIMPENRACMMGETRCGKTDFCNNPSVLLDNIEPHWDANFAGGAIDRSWQVKLPDVECDNCTLQIIQIMTDPAGGAHGPYDLMNDVYHQCMDVTLKRGSGMNANMGPAMNSVPMMECAQTMVAAPGGAGGASGAGGMSGSIAGTGAAQAGASGAPSMPSGGVAGMSSSAPKPPAGPTTATGTAGVPGGMAVQAGAPAMSLPAPAPAAGPKDSGGGCSIAAGPGFDLPSLGWVGAALLALAPRRRTSRPTTRRSN
jgi:hypothetical protein